MANQLRLFQPPAAELPRADGCGRRQIGDENVVMLVFPPGRVTVASWPWVMATLPTPPLVARVVFLMASGTQGTVELGVSIALVSGRDYAYDTEQTAIVTVSPTFGTKTEIMIPIMATAGALPGDSIRVRLRNLSGTATAAGDVYVSSLAFEDSA